MGKDTSDSSTRRGSNVKSGGCCGFTTKKSETSWRVARHGSFQLTKDQMQIKETDQAAQLPVYIHLCEAQAVERSIRSKTAKSYRKQRGIKRRRKKRKKLG